MDSVMNFWAKTAPGSGVVTKSVRIAVEWRIDAVMEEFCDVVYDDVTSDPPRLS